MGGAPGKGIQHGLTHPWLWIGREQCQVSGLTGRLDCSERIK